MTEAEENALQKQIDTLGSRMDKNFDEIKDMFTKSEDRVRKLENEQAGCLPLTNARLTAVETITRGHDQQIMAINESVQAMEAMNKNLAWIGGIAGGAVILWFVSQFLGMIGK